MVRIWRGRRGTVILGPTEDRVARYLEDATRNGRIRIRTLELASRLGLERSEAYRVTRRLRVLGLFGIENDRSGAAGGRAYWRTAIEHDGAELDRIRHRDAWARVVGWSRSARARAFGRLAFIRRRAGTATAVPPAGVPHRPAGPSFRDLFAAAPGGAALLTEWKVAT